MLTQLFNNARRIVNPLLRRLLGLELCLICDHEGKSIGIGIRLQQPMDRLSRLLHSVPMPRSHE